LTWVKKPEIGPKPQRVILAYEETPVDIPRRYPDYEQSVLETLNYHASKNLFEVIKDERSYMVQVKIEYEKEYWTAPILFTPSWRQILTAIRIKIQPIIKKVFGRVARAIFYLPEEEES
jgi:hypothetical protein